jgi:hypothetical protein
MAEKDPDFDVSMTSYDSMVFAMDSMNTNKNNYSLATF